ncbi:MAG: potassium channel family protein [Rubricella sp.]
MRIVIVGASRFGVATAKKLVSDGNEVVLVDENRDRLDRVADQLDCGLVHGDGTLPSTLRDAYSDGCDALITLTNESNANILAATVGRSIGYRRVIPQIVEPELLSVCEELGLDDVITPHETVAESIVVSLKQSHGSDPGLRLSGALRGVSLSVPERLAGKTMKELDLPEGTLAIAHSRDGDESLPSDDLKLKKNDVVMFVTRAEKVETLAEYFRSSRDADEKAES